MERPHARVYGNIMPLSSMLKSAAGTCPFCYQKAGIISRQYPECRPTYQTPWDGSPARRAASLYISPGAGLGKPNSVAPWPDCEPFHSRLDGAVG